MALANLMRLSLKKAAHVAVGWDRVGGDPGFAPTAGRGRRDDKSEGGCFRWHLLAEERAGNALTTYVRAEARTLQRLEFFRSL